MTESRNGPKGFIAVLPEEIIEIPQDDDKSRLTNQQFGNLVGNLTDIIVEEETGSRSIERFGQGGLCSCPGQFQ